MKRLPLSVFIAASLIAAPFLRSVAEPDPDALAALAREFLAPLTPASAPPPAAPDPNADGLAELRAQVRSLRAGRHPTMDPLVYLEAVVVTADKLKVGEDDALRVFISEGPTKAADDEEYFHPALLFLGRRLGLDQDALRGVYHDHLDRSAHSDPERGWHGGTPEGAALEDEAIARALRDNPKDLETKYVEKIKGHARAVADELNLANYTDGVSGAPGAVVASQGAAADKQASRRLPDHQLEGHLATTSPAPPELESSGRYRLVGDFPKAADGTVEMRDGDAAMVYEGGGVTHASLIIRLSDGRYLRRDSQPKHVGSPLVYPTLREAATENLKPGETADLVYVPSVTYPDGTTSGDEMLRFMRTQERARDAMPITGATGSNWFYYCSYDTAAILMHKEIGRQGHTPELSYKDTIRNALGDVKLRVLSMAAVSPTTLRYAIAYVQ